jgi:hypothetical protein
LQRILGVLRRAQDPVAVDLQLAPVRVDELSKCLRVSCLGLGDQIHGHRATFASPLPPVRRQY